MVTIPDVLASELNKDFGTRSNSHTTLIRNECNASRETNGMTYNEGSGNGNWKKPGHVHLRNTHLKRYLLLTIMVVLYKRVS